MSLLDYWPVPMALVYFVFIYLYSIPVAGIARELEAEQALQVQAV
jgi:hypothetical protein